MPSLTAFAEIVKKLSRFSASDIIIRRCGFDTFHVFGSSFWIFLVQKDSIRSKKIRKTLFFLTSTLSLEGITDFPCLKNSRFQSEIRSSKVLLALNADILEWSVEILESVI